MSVVYEPRNFIHDGSYPPIDDHPDPAPDAGRYPDPDEHVVTELAASVAAGAYNAPSMLSDSQGRLELAPPSLPKEESPTTPTPARIKPIPKPDRDVTKYLEGKYVCTWEECTEDVWEFQRKCEWKYVCPDDRNMAAANLHTS
jgi:hypothetical protein